MLAHGSLSPRVDYLTGADPHNTYAMVRTYLLLFHNLQRKPSLRNTRLLCERPRRKGVYTTHTPTEPLADDY